MMLSKYTTEVRFICETLAGKTESVGYTDTSEVIAAARPLLFNFDYPIYDVTYRPVIETKILRHFYTREIGAETVGLWKMWLETRLNEIMPYYNQLYESALLEINPLYNVDMTKDYQLHKVGENHKTTAGDNTSDGTGSASNTNWNLYSDTPQGGLTNIDKTADAGGNELKYLTNITKNTDNGSTTDHNRTDYNDQVDGDFDTVDDYLEHVKGYKGGNSMSKLLLEYRETFLNIDMMIIHELDDLFLNLW